MVKGPKDALRDPSLETLTVADRAEFDHFVAIIDTAIDKEWRIREVIGHMTVALSSPNRCDITYLVKEQLEIQYGKKWKRAVLQGTSDDRYFRLENPKSK